MSQIRYRFEGPFDSHYSLAILNREMARAVEMLRPGTVALHSTEGAGDYQPSQECLQDDPVVRDLWQRSQQQQGGAEVVLRNLYPPRVTEMNGRYRAMNMYGWEESYFPREYVMAFNRYLDVVTVMSAFVRKVLIDSGVNVPVIPIGVGVDHILRYGIEPVVLPHGSAFCFLHVSSCFPRKGVDILLQAYATAFSVSDNVRLVIKTFPNSHNTVAEQIQQVQRQYPQCPPIVLINEEMRTAQLNSLYQQADVLVAPSRGEGFGMPMAEAMLWDVPVITTGFGGQTDFCTPETSWLVDYQFAKAQSHVTQGNAVWVEPNGLHLASLMRTIYDLSHTQEGQGLISAKTAKAKAAIETTWCWQAVAQRLLATLDTLPDVIEKRVPNVAWVSTWNTRCGIATYSKFLLTHLPKATTVFANLDSELLGQDEPYVQRCWRTTSSEASPSLTELGNTLLAGHYSDVFIQFNFGFFDLANLQQLLQQLSEKGIAVYVTFHATADVLHNEEVKKTLRQIVAELATCKRLLVHGLEDLNRLKRFGLVDNVSLLPHGVIYQPALWQRPHAASASANIRRIAAYGFLLPKKGFPELIAAFQLLRQRLARDGVDMDLRLELYNALYPASVSKHEWERCVDSIRMSECRAFIRLDTTFYEDAETLRALSACDIVVFPYQQSRESASGAVRLALAAGRAVACTPLAIFDDIKAFVHVLPGFSPQQIAAGLYPLLMDESRLYQYTQAQVEWLESNAWQQVASYLHSIIDAK